jgi:hypothetical protein
LKCACLFNDAVSDPEWFNAFYMMKNSRPIWSYSVGTMNNWKNLETPPSTQRTLDRHLNPEPPWHEAGALPVTVNKWEL